MHTGPNKDIWDKIAAVSGLIASLVIPLAVVITASRYSTAQKDSENAVRYMEVAISILSDESKRSSTHLRDWAVDVLAKHSPVPLTPDVQAALKEHGLTRACLVGNATGVASATGDLRVTLPVSKQLPAN